MSELTDDLFWKKMQFNKSVFDLEKDNGDNFFLCLQKGIIQVEMLIFRQEAMK